jgi:hypothetical protein
MGVRLVPIQREAAGGPQARLLTGLDIITGVFQVSVGAGFSLVVRTAIPGSGW